mgnify:FL=1
MEEDNNLPVLHESEEPSAIEQLRAELARRDGYLSPSNAQVPREAVDVGDVGHSPNPRAVELGYQPVHVKEVQEFEGHTYLSDGRCGPSADIGIDADNFIEDLSDWA